MNADWEPTREELDICVNLGNMESEEGLGENLASSSFALLTYCVAHGKALSSWVSVSPSVK